MHFPWAGHHSGEEVKLGVVDLRKASFSWRGKYFGHFWGQGKARENFWNEVEETF